MNRTKQEFLSKPLRIAAVQYGQRPEDTMKVPALLAEGGFNVEQLLHVVGREGYGLYNKKLHSGILRRYTEESTKRGVDIILYANAHMVEPEKAPEHPDWAQIDMEGKPAVADGINVLACVNSPWRGAFFEQLRDSLEQDIRGIFLDGPIFLAGGCHCPHCRRLFQDEFSHQMEDATQAELCAFKSEHIGRFVRDVRGVIRESGRDVALYANCLGLVENITGCTVDAVYPYVDLIGTEGGFLFYGDPNEVSLWHGSESAKFMESKSQGKPYVIFSAGNDQPWAREMHTVPETVLLYGSAVANGGNVWYGIHGLIGSFRTSAGETAFRFNRFLAKNEKYFAGTEQCADTALLWSQQTADIFPEDAAQTDFIQAKKAGASHSIGSFRKEFRGFSELLFRMHAQFAILDETCIRHGDLKKYRTLVLPNACCMDDATAAAIRAFAEDGGNVIATLESGRYDKNGNLREKPPLWELLGIRVVENVEDAETGCAYLKFTDAPLAQIGSEPVAGFTTGVLRCSYVDGRTLAESFCPMKGRYGAFNEESYPSVTARKCGKGTVVYIAGGLAQTFLSYGLPEMKSAAESLVQWLTPGLLRVENAFSSVEVELRRQTGRLLLHFVNHTGCMRRPVEKFIPCRGIRIALKTNEPVRRVHALFHEKEIPFRWEGGEVRFTADVEDYELIAVELEAPAQG